MSDSFDSGVWTGAVAVLTQCFNARLAADWDGDAYSMCSNAFDVLGNMHVLLVSSSAHGTISPDGVIMVADGGETNFLMISDAYYHIGDISTNGVTIGGVFGMLATNFVWSNVTENGTIDVSFDENLAIHDVPEWWLARFGWTSNFNAAAMADLDGDGVPAWAEYSAGTIPTNSESVFKATHVEALNSNAFIIRWASVSNKYYALMRATNLIDGFLPLASNIPATPVENTYTDTVNGSEMRFYRIQLENQ